MARNKHPEETVRKILDVSQRLFQEKGYEGTTVQDIVDALGLSKGAIYHHFRSKEDILDRLNDRYYEELDWYPDPSCLPGANGLEKLRYAFRHFLSDPQKLEMDRLTIRLLKNPKLVVLSLDSIFLSAAPYMERLVQEAMADGSACPEFPHELSETFMMLSNIWTGMHPGTREEFRQKFLFCKVFLERFGLPILTDDLVEVAVAYYDQVLAPPPGAAP